jgi:uncharacterized protein (DUF983 family)
MTEYKTFLFQLLIVCLIVYFGGTFIENSFNIANWRIDTRETMVTVAATYLMILLFAKFIKEET